MVRAGGLQGYEALMRRLGTDPVPLMRRHGIAARTLADEDALLPLPSALDLLERSAQQTGLLDFGLRLAQSQDISLLGPIALAMQHCPTVAEAFDCLSRYLFVQSPGIALTVHRQSDLQADAAELRYEVTSRGRLFPRQTFDHGMGVVHRILGLLAGSRYRLYAVSLPYEPEAPVPAHTRFFHARIITGQPHCALHFNRASLSTPVPSANAALLRIATNYLATHYSGPAHTMAPRVRLALSHTLASGAADKNAIAALLSMHPRTLQRHLEREGTNFNAIRDEVRSQSALRYLKGTKFPFSQVADLLGFSEQSTFTRFCRQRLGNTPSAIRAAGPDKN